MIPTSFEIVPRWTVQVGTVAVFLGILPWVAFAQHPGPTAEESFASAVRLYEQRLYPNAEVSLSQYRTRHPDHIQVGEALFLQANAALAQSHEADAIRLYGALERSYSSHPRAAEAQINLAQYFLDQGNAHDAREQLRTLIDSRSGAVAAQALYLRGSTARERGDFDAALRDFERVFREHPESGVAPAALYSSGVVQVRMERYDAAASSFETLGSRFPESPLAQNLGTALGDTYYRLDNYEAAVEELQPRLPELSDEERTRALFLIAESYNQLDRGDEAERYYQQVLEGAGPDSPYVVPAMYGLAWHHYSSGDYETAGDTFARVRRRDTGRRADRALYYEAVSRARAGDRARALELYQRVPDRLPDSRLAAEARFEAGLLHYQDEQFSEAVSAFRSVLQSPSGAQEGDAHYWLGNALLAQEEFDGALQAYSRAEELGAGSDSLTREVRFQHGRALYRNGQYEEAASRLLSLADAQPESTPGADALFWGADSHFHQDNLSRARQLFQRYLNTYPKGRHRDGALYALGWAYFKQEQYEPAAQTFRRFLDAYTAADEDIPYRQDARLRLGDAYFALKQYDRAVETYRQVEGQGADYARYQSGEALRYADRSDEAIRVLDQLLERYPSSDWRPEALYRLGTIHFQEQNYESARETFRRFVETYPDHRLAPAARYGIGDSYYNAGAMRDAVRAYRTVLERYPDSETASDAASSLFFALNAAGQSERAEGLIDSIAATHPDASLGDRLRFQRAKAAFQSGDSKRALSLFQEFVRTSSLDALLPQAYYFLGVLYADREEYTEATNYLEQLVDRYSETPRQPQGALRLGDIRREEGNFEAAADAYQVAAESDLINEELRAQARYGQAMALLELDRNEAARSLLTRLLDESRQGPIEASARLGLARIHEEEGSTSEALDEYRSVVEMTDGETGAEALYRLGHLLRDQNQPDAAIQELERMSSLFAGYPEWEARALLEQARAYRDTGETGQASQLYDEVIRSFSGTPFAETAQSEQEAL